MDQDLQNLQKKVEEQGVKIDAIFKSVEKTRKYFLIITWITILAIVLPMIGLVFAIPSFLSNYTSVLGGSGF
jgi:t-SNARE complex subunit (syntaxin)